MLDDARWAASASTHTLFMLASGAPQEEILADYPYLEADDILACLEYAVLEADHAVLGEEARAIPRRCAAAGPACSRGYRGFRTRSFGRR